MRDDLRNRVARAKAAYDDHRDIASQQEPDATSEYIAALEAERDENWQKYVDANEARIDADAALAEMGGGEWSDKPDDWTDRIKADFHTDGFYSRYAQALDLVSNRHSKSALVALVCYLLRPAAIEPASVSAQLRACVSPDHAWEAVEAALFRAIAEGKDND